MPCGQEGSGTITVYTESGTQTARLCAVLTVLEKREMLAEILDQVDWKEAGLSRDKFEAFWRRHKEDDERRRAREAKAEEDRRKREEVIANLTDEQRRVLGIKR